MTALQWSTFEIFFFSQHPYAFGDRRSAAAAHIGAGYLVGSREASGF